MSKLTHIAAVRAQQAYDRMQVLWLTGMTEEELFGFQLDLGIAWLTNHVAGERALMEELMKQEEIWGWWKNEWARRDHTQYLPALYAIRHPGDRLARYRAMHQDIFIRWSPPYTLLENAYAVGIGKMFDQLNK